MDLLAGLAGIIEEQVEGPLGGMVDEDPLEDRPLGMSMNESMKREKSLISLQYVFNPPRRNIHP